MFSETTTYFEDMSGRSLRELDEELATLSAHVSAGMCRVLELVAEFDRREAWTGWRSCAAWLAWRCSLARRSAREQVRVARALRELPLVHAAFARGELSYAKVRALTRVATEETEQELVELAATLTASQLERAVRAYRRVTTAEANETQTWETVSYVWNDDSLELRARLAPEDGALFLKALETAREQLWQEQRLSEKDDGSAEPPPRRPSNADALVAMADNALGAAGDGRPGGDRYLVVVHVEQAAIAGADGSAFLEAGPALSPETVRRLTCDASIVTLLEKKGKPLSVGRRTRQVPLRLRRALLVRDAGCRFPGCTATGHLQAHHIDHWANGGETSVDNLLLLCRRHHRLLHEGGFTVDRQLTFRDPWGNAIPYVPLWKRGSARALEAANRHLTITAATARTGSGEPMQLALAVDWIFGIFRRRGQPPPWLRPA